MPSCDTVDTSREGGAERWQWRGGREGGWREVIYRRFEEGRLDGGNEAWERGRFLWRDDGRGK